MEGKKEKKVSINFDEMENWEGRREPFYQDVVIYSDGTTNRKDDKKEEAES